MGSSLQNCLKFRQQDEAKRNQEAAWRELEYLASDGKLLLFVDNVDKPITADPGLQKLRSISGALVLTSRKAYYYSGVSGTSGEDKTLDGRKAEE